MTKCSSGSNVWEMQGARGLWFARGEGNMRVSGRKT